MLSTHSLQLSAWPASGETRFSVWSVNLVSGKGGLGDELASVSVFRAHSHEGVVDFFGLAAAWMCGGSDSRVADSYISVARQGIGV